MNVQNYPSHQQFQQNVKHGMAVADRGYALQMGENRFEGPTDELLNNEQIREVYVGG